MTSPAWVRRIRKRPYNGPLPAPDAKTLRALRKLAAAYLDGRVSQAAGARKARRLGR
jgi:hypothetical protein